MELRAHTPEMNCLGHIYGDISKQLKALENFVGTLEQLDRVTIIMYKQTMKLTFLGNNCDPYHILSIVFVNVIS